MLVYADLALASSSMGTAQLISLQHRTKAQRLIKCERKTIPTGCMHSETKVLSVQLYFNLQIAQIISLSLISTQHTSHHTSNNKSHEGIPERSHSETFSIQSHPLQITAAARRILTATSRREQSHHFLSYQSRMASMTETLILTEITGTIE